MHKKKKMTVSDYRAPLRGPCCPAAIGRAAPGFVAAQGAGDPPVLFFDIATGLSYENGLNRDDEVEATARFGVGYFTSTHDQRLSFETGISARGVRMIST
jgi:hypothetical protein